MARTLNILFAYPPGSSRRLVNTIVTRIGMLSVDSLRGPGGQGSLERNVENSGGKCSTAAREDTPWRALDS
ncbi:hypothetical protein M3J09_005030 [Ascochyta lentis]